tara:strand:+ start:1270 stop:2097 length:828 start_codon:yes stop_codon:yes gene_type:complete
MNAQEIKQIIAETVTGKIEPRHTDKGHFYCFVDSGHIVSSVTGKIGILSKPHLITWAVKMGALWLIEDQSRLKRLGQEEWQQAMINGMQLAHTDTRDAAGATGTIAHDAAERYINDWIASGTMPEDIKVFAKGTPDPRAIASMRAVEAFFHKHDIIPLASEILVGDKRYSAGTLDFLCLMDGNLTLIDFKTSNGVDQLSYSAQVAAYKYFFEGMTGLKIKACKILHLSKDYDKFTVYKVNNAGKAWRAFKHMCAVHKWMYEKDEKISKDVKRMKI